MERRKHKYKMTREYMTLVDQNRYWFFLEAKQKNIFFNKHVDVLCMLSWFLGCSYEGVVILLEGRINGSKSSRRKLRKNLGTTELFNMISALGRQMVKIRYRSVPKAGITM